MPSAELEQELEAIRASNTVLIQDLARQRVGMDPKTGMDLVINELFDSVFPPDTDERTAMLIRVEKKIETILKDAKAQAIKRMLTEGLRPA